MWLVSVRDLQFRARRFVIAVVVTALVFGIALAMDGMRRSVQRETPAIVALFGADHWIVARGATGPFTTTRVLDTATGGALRRESGVKRADAVVLSRTVIAGKPTKDANLVGHVLGGLGSPPISNGRAAAKSGEAVISQGISTDVGKRIVVGGKDFRVVGTTAEGRYYFGIPTVFVSLHDAQEIVFKGQPLAMGIAVKGTPTAPAGTRAVTNEQVVSDLNRPLAGGVQSIVVMAVLMWLIAAGIIGLIVYLSAIERMRDFAVFKATGAPTRHRGRAHAPGRDRLAGRGSARGGSVEACRTRFAVPVGARRRGHSAARRDQPCRGGARKPRRGAACADDRPRRRVRRVVMPEIRVRDLTMEYSSGGYVVRPFDHFELDLATGNLALLLGASGCGKTTLLSMLASILTPTSGSIHVGDIEVTALKGAELAAYRRRTVGVVFQAFNLVPSLTAHENLYIAMRYAGVGRAAAKSRSEELLAMVGLEDRMHHRPGKLSGGQQQRVAIARALALDPPLIVADEPTASLDYVQVDGVIRLLRELAAPGRVVVIATHDERLLPLADRVVELTPRPSSESRPPDRVELAAGEVLFRQGAVGDLVYEVNSGRIDIVQEMADGSENVLAIVEPDNYFGELRRCSGSGARRPHAPARTRRRS